MSEIMNGRKSRRLLAVLIAVIVALAGITAEVFAAQAVISFSNSSPNVGDSFTVTVTYSGETMTGVEGALTYDSSLLEYTGSNLDYVNGGNGELIFSYANASGTTNISMQFYFKVITSGTGTVAVNTYNLFGAESEELSFSDASASFTASKVQTETAVATETTEDTKDEEETEATETTETTETAEKSSDANLTYMVVSCGDLSPSFSADVTEYTVHADSDATDCTITVNTSDSNAKVSVSGDREFGSATELTRSVTVTAEDGTQKTYTIHAIKDASADDEEESESEESESEESESEESESESEESENSEEASGTVEIDGVTYVAVTPDTETAPGGFGAVTANIGGKDVTVLESYDGDLTLVYLENQDSGEKSYFVYDTKTGEYTPADIIEVDGTNYLRVGSGLDALYGANGSEEGYWLYDSESGELKFISANNTKDEEEAAASVSEESASSEAQSSEASASEETAAAETKTGSGFSGIAKFLIPIAIILLAGFIAARVYLSRANKKLDSYDDDDDDFDGYDDYSDASSAGEAPISEVSADAEGVNMDAAKAAADVAGAVDTAEAAADNTASAASAAVSAAAGAVSAAGAEAADVTENASAELSGKTVGIDPVVPVEQAQAKAARQAEREAEEAAKAEHDAQFAKKMDELRQATAKAKQDLDEISDM